jgi:uncharacterized protein
MRRPFIQLFHTPNSFYILDVNKDVLLEVCENSYRYLVEAFGQQDGVMANNPMPDELLGLIDTGYLSFNSAVEEVVHPATNILEYLLERKLPKITLQLTQDCNFRCAYCIYAENEKSRQRTHSRKRMNWETAKKSIDFLWEHSVDSERVNIGFYGGEPLMEFRLLMRVVDYSRHLFEGKDLSFTMTTNGALLTDEIIHYLDENDVATMISLDGPKEVNDKNRVFENGEGTYDVVMSRISRIKEIAPDLYAKLQISMVIDPDNDYDCINEICLDSGDLGRLNISSSLVSSEYIENPLPISDDYRIKSEYQRFLAILEYFGRFSKALVTPIVTGDLWTQVVEFNSMASGSKLSKSDNPSGVCIPGQMRLFVSVDGNFFPCERVSENSQCMIIGNVHTGFNLQKAEQQLNIGRLTANECVSCWCFRYCDMCVKKADSGDEFLSPELKLSFCEQTRSNVYGKFRLYLLFKEIPKYYRSQVRAKAHAVSTESEVF